jgi:transposase
VNKKLVANEIRNEFVRLYVEEKWSAKRIGKALGFGPTTVYRHLDSLGVNRVDAVEGSRRRGQRGRVYKSSLETEKEIVEQYRSGLSTKFLAQRYGYHPGGISKIIKRHGYTTRSRGNSYAEINGSIGSEIIRLFEDGLSASAIGAKFRLSYPNVCRYLKSKGIQPGRYKASRENHPSWKGGRSFSGGYVAVRLDSHSQYWSMAQSGGAIFEHRLVMAQYLGRPLYQWESVHHVDGNKVNNDITNLQLRIGKHGNGVQYKCMECGSKKIEPVGV